MSCSIEFSFAFECQVAVVVFILRILRIFIGVVVRFFSVVKVGVIARAVDVVSDLSACNWLPKEIASIDIELRFAALGCELFWRGNANFVFGLFILGYIKGAT